MVSFDVLVPAFAVLLLIAAGVLARRRDWLSSGTIADLKKLVVNFSLPALLFLAFSQIKIESSHLAIAALMFGACGAALVLARLVQPWLGIQTVYFPTLMTGFEAGMLGYAIFTAVYGPENVFKFGVVDLGQVLFVFFVLVPVLESFGAGRFKARKVILNFIRTPVILAILSGLVVGRAGWFEWLSAFQPGAVVLEALRLASTLTTPLVALIIGYEIRLQGGRLGKPLLAAGLRLVFWLPFGFLLNSLIIHNLLGLDAGFQAAVMTMVILPPPFVIPIFMRGETLEERTFVVNTLSVATLLTLLLFVGVSAWYGS